MSKIAILCPYPFDTAPCQRFRYEQYLEPLRNQGLKIDVFPFLDEKTNNILSKPDYTFQKIYGVFKGIVKRFKLLFSILPYDYIFIHREAILIGPPIYEWILTKIFRKKIILDFDDAIWMDKTVSGSSLIGKLRNPWKTPKLIRWSYKISCGNQFLADYALQFNSNVSVIPTTIDTVNYHNQTKEHLLNKKPIILGWTGTITTLPYLENLIPVFDELYSKNKNFELHVICNKNTENKRPYLRFIPWKASTEIIDLLNFDIGVMPLLDTDWEKGKCGFKALQYMALAIPAIASSVGVNISIIQNKENGILVNSNEEWLEAIELLISNPDLRKNLGLNGQETVQKSYSVLSQLKHYKSLFS